MRLPIITKHAKKRLKQRLGLAKRAHKKMYVKCYMKEPICIETKLKIFFLCIIMRKSMCLV